MTKVMQRWTDEEKELLEEIYNDSRDSIMEHFPTRTWKSVIHMINRMELPREKEWVKFTKEEDNILTENYTLPREELNALLPHRRWDSIIQRCTKLELDRPKAWNLWTEDEETILRDCLSYEEAEERLPHRNRTMIISKAVKMELVTQLTSHWQEWEDEYLLNNYEDIIDVKDMLKVLTKRNLSGIYTRAYNMGLSRGNDDKSIDDDDIVELYNSGMFVAQIAREIGTGSATVKSRLIKNGIYPEPKILYGPESPAWRGGLTDKNVTLRGRSEYRGWRKEVFERDNYTCQRCGDNTGGNLNAHHIKNFSSHVESRYDIDNGITLCRACHTDGPDSFHSKYGTVNNSAEQLAEHLSNYRIYIEVS